MARFWRRRGRKKRRGATETDATPASAVTDNTFTATPPDPQALLSLRDVRRAVPLPDGSELKILRGIDLDVHAGDHISIVGRSGTGKSTLLNIIGLLDLPNSGTYLVQGKNVAKLGESALAARRGATFGFVFQQFNLFEARTAAQNVEVPLLYTVGKDFWMRAERAVEMLEKVGLGERADSSPAQMSGGEQQRVAIARALVRRPRVVLADEPTGALDPDTGAQVMDLLEETCRRNNAALIVITHDMNIAQRAGTVYSLSEGKLHPLRGGEAAGDTATADTPTFDTQPSATGNAGTTGRAKSGAGAPSGSAMFDSMGNQIHVSTDNIEGSFGPTDKPAGSGGGGSLADIYGRAVDPVGEAMKDAAKALKPNHWTRSFEMSEDVQITQINVEQIQAENDFGYTAPTVKFVDPDYATIFPSKILVGRWLRASDVQLRYNPVVTTRYLYRLLGSPALTTHPTVTFKNLGPDRQPINLTVVGVRQGNNEFDNSVFLPYETGRFVLDPKIFAAAQPRMQIWVGENMDERIPNLYKQIVGGKLGESWTVDATYANPQSMLGETQNVVVLVVSLVGLSLFSWAPWGCSTWRWLPCANASARSGFAVP